MKIGVLAKAVNCHVETVRYYVKKGLLPPHSKASNGYGEYSETHLKLLRLIRYSKRLGFSQEQSRELVQLVESKNIHCEEVRGLIATQSEIVEEKIRSLKKLQLALTQISNDCQNCADSDCSVFDEIMDASRG